MVIAHVEIRHLLTAVIMTAPATLMLAKMLMPETGKPETAGGVKIESRESPEVNLIDGGSWRGRRIAACAQYRRHADRVHWTDRTAERNPVGDQRIEHVSLAARTSMQGILGKVVFAPLA